MSRGDNLHPEAAADRAANLPTPADTHPDTALTQGLANRMATNSVSKSADDSAKDGTKDSASNPPLDPSCDSPLGKPTAYHAYYNPALLYPIARQGKRDALGLTANALPFVGEDVWNAYEVSWLNPKGKPQVALATWSVPAHSPQLIESKSLKLYLNSFNQSVFADVASVATLIAKDLSTAAGAPVMIKIAEIQRRPPVNIAYPTGILLDDLDIACDAYQPTPAALVTVNGEITEETVYSHLLKSNCLVTGQPDWAMVVIRYRGAPIDHAGLLRYIVSFRNHNEFHEQCVERIFCDIQRQCAPQALQVYARYTRRGGLDINPVRSCGYFPLPDNEREVRQ